jgi:Flp pilus assembly protein TadB
MKKFVALFFASVFMVQAFAAVNVELPVRKASEIYLPVGTTGKTVSLQALATMSPKEYQSLTGQHLKLSDKVALKLTQKELRKVINPDGTVNVKKLESLNKKMQKAAADNKKNLRLALIFLGAAIVLSIIGSFVPFLWILASLAYLASVVYFIIWLVNMAQ